MKRIISLPPLITPAPAGRAGIVRRVSDAELMRAFMARLGWRHHIAQGIARRGVRRARGPNPPTQGEGGETPPPPPPPDVQWPNMPSTMTVMTDVSCHERPFANWSFENRQHDRIIGDPTAIFSPTPSANNVLECKYPLNFEGGSSPYRHWFIHSKRTETYLGIVFKLSLNWTAEVVYRFFVWVMSPNNGISYKADGSTEPFIANVNFPYNGANPPPRVLNPNVAGGLGYRRDRWYRAEYYHKYNSPNNDQTPNGIVRWWLTDLSTDPNNPKLTGNYTDVLFPIDTVPGFMEAQLVGVWAGAGFHKPADEHIYYDHIRLARA